MRTNRRMSQLIASCNIEPGPLTCELSVILGDGLVYRNGCLLLKSHLITEAYSRERFHDETGYECFANHFHLEDKLPPTCLCKLLAQALAFGDALKKAKADTGVMAPLEYIIAGDSHGMNVRFHIHREGQSWLAEDLDGYDDPVAVISLL